MIKQSNLTRGIAKTELDYVPFGFGLDQVTPSNQTVPGSLRTCRNYEININGGYTGIRGYERFDGQSAPSDAIYYRLDVTITGSFTAGDIVTDAGSAAFGTVLAINTEYSASQAFLILGRVTGSFVQGNNLKVGATVEGQADSAQIASAAPGVDLDAQYRNLAADEQRNDITAVPGSGKVLGVWMFDDEVYAFRNNVGGTAAAMFKSSSSGWVAVSLGRELAFTSGGTTEIAEGDLIEGIASGASATVTRVVLENGSWAAGTAEGRFIFASQTGSFESEAIEVSASGDIATITDDSEAITLLPDGRYEFVTFGFGGNERVYGVDRVNRGFEFDGTVFAPISTGMVVDAPNHVEVFKNHLFYAFAGSAQHSAINDPYIWSPVFGAGELAVGSPVTAFQVQPGDEGGGTLAIISRNRITMLYGTSSVDWELVQFRREVGAFAYSTQEFGITLMMDDRGVVSLETAQEHGNFNHSVVSRLVQPFVSSRKAQVTASCIARDKAQYRLFFADGSALYITTDNDNILGMMTQLFTHVVECVCSIEESNGGEGMYFGSSDGFIYQMDRGTSFDGDNIERDLTLHYHHSGSPRIEKSYFDISFEISGSGYSGFSFRYELGYNQQRIPQAISRDIDVTFSQAAWDSFIWGNFTWDGSVLAPLGAELNGSAENISLIFSSSSDYYEPLTFSGAEIRQTSRKQLRS